MGGRRGVNAGTKIIQIPTKNLSDHADLSCELLTSLLIRAIHMGEISELGWLIALVKHAVLGDSLYFLYWPLLLIYKTPVLSRPTVQPSS
jgi:hypothetical protein